MAAISIACIACLVIIFISSVSSITPSLILDSHNKARAAKGVAPLVYNNSIAAMAQSYAGECIYAHSGRAGYGENIAAWIGDATQGTSMDESQNGMQNWIDREYPNYNCGVDNVPTCTGGPGECLHYTQAVWASTTQIGCGLQYCTINSPSSEYPTWWFYVCNFYPPGNYGGEEPFPASQCNNIAPCSPVTSCALSGLTSGMLFDGCNNVSCSAGASTATATTTSIPITSTSSSTTSKPKTSTTTSIPITSSHSTTTAKSSTTSSKSSSTTSVTFTVSTEGTSTAGASTAGASTASASTASASTASASTASASTASASTASTSTASASTASASTAATSTAAASTASSASSTTASLTPGCYISASASVSVSKSKYLESITFTNTGTETIKTIKITITGSGGAMSGLTHLSSGGSNVYTVTSAPIAPGASAPASFSFPETASYSWTFTSVICG